jgi:hypothetical protein
VSVVKYFAVRCEAVSDSVVTIRMPRVSVIAALTILILQVQHGSAVALPTVEDPRAERSIVFVDAGPYHGVAVAIARSGSRTIFLTANHVIRNAGPPETRESAAVKATPIEVRQRKEDFPPKVGTWIANDHDPNVDLALFAVDNYALPPFCLGTQAARSSNVDLATYSQDAYIKEKSLTPLETGARITGVPKVRNARTFYFDANVIEGYSGSPIFESDSGLLVGIAISYSKDAILERRGVDAHEIMVFYRTAQHNHPEAALPDITAVQNGAEALYNLGAASRNVLSYRLYLDLPEPTNKTDRQFYGSLNDKLVSQMRKTFGPAVTDELRYSPAPSNDAICASTSTPGVVVVSLNKPSSPMFNPEFSVTGSVGLIRCLDRRDRKRIAVESRTWPQSAKLAITISGLKGVQFDSWVTQVSAAIAQGVGSRLADALGPEPSAPQNFYYAGVPLPDAGTPTGKSFCGELAYHGSR